jgi:hypothetical protein
MTRRELHTRAYLAGRLKTIGLLLLAAASTANGWRGLSDDSDWDRGLQYSDMAVLASPKQRADFSCQVTHDKPWLGFDLRFRSTYLVTVPVKVLLDAGGWVQVVMRVTPMAENKRPVYMVHRYAIPEVPVGTNREAELSSGINLGPGRYRLDWMMSDARQRVCSSHWELDAKLTGSDRDLPLTLGPNRVADSNWDASGDVAQPTLDPAKPLRVKILLNLTPGDPRRSIVKPEETRVLFSMLRSITGQPRIARFTLVAFNLREQKIVYRQENGDRIDFAALRRTMQSPTAGTIDFHLLDDPQSETNFVTRLLTDQLGAQADTPDAIVIVGPKVRLERKVPLESLRAKGAVSCPLVYLNYNSDPVNEPWPDTIGSALKAYKGASAYNIILPHDVGIAIRELLSRIAKQPASGQLILGTRDGTAFSPL